jgi:hypothetical protein
VSTKGFTLLEAIVATGILMVLFGVALGAIGDMTYFLGSQDTVSSMALNSSTGLTKLHQELREVGVATVAGTTYPRVNATGTELQFVTLADPPCTYDGSTDLRWNPTVYTVKEENGELGIWQDTTLELLLCQNVQTAVFAMRGRKITVDIELQALDARGQPLTEQFRRIIVMRN